MFQKLALFSSSGKEALNFVDPIYQSILKSLGTIRAVNLLKYAPETRSSPGVVTGKWLLKN
jgi:hypothetical protein